MSDKKSSNAEVALQNALKFFNNNEFAATTFLNKYALKDKEGNYLETDPIHTINRVMKVLSESMPEEYPSFETRARLKLEEGQSWEDIFIKACDEFNGVCPQGSILSAAGDTDHPQSLSNCFVIESPHDSIPGIMKTSEEEASLMKRRGGVGLCISTLRPDGTSVNNAAKTSTGAVGWMDHFSNVCRSIGQKSRRGALMITIDVTHPDVAAFARAKLDRSYCTGANVSIKLSDKFMKAVKGDKEFKLQWPVDSKNPEYSSVVKARELWGEITSCAHECGEPGLLFWDNATRTLPAHCYPDFKTTGVNPCAELLLSNNDSCRLITICLIKYIRQEFTEEAYFDFEAFERDIRIAMRMMDSVVTAEVGQIDIILEKIKKDREKHESGSEIYNTEITLWEKIRESAINGRRTGLGTHGLADCLAQLGLKYDSEEAVQQVKDIYTCLKDCAYDESAEMAKEYGAFPAFDWETEKDCEFIKRLPKNVQDKIKESGRRNISLLTNAPTGTISILSRVSSGIEPTFRQIYTRRRKINPNDEGTRVDFVCEKGDKWMEFAQFEENVKRYAKVAGIELPDNLKCDADLEKYLPEYFITSDKIDWKKRIEIQGAIQFGIDHSISSTINLPSDTTVEHVAEIYEYAWEKGLKGVTVYRDGCRDNVLLTGEEVQDSIVRVEAPKRPAKLPCEVHFTKVKGEDYIVIVGLLNGSVYEVFFGKHANRIPKKQFSAFVEKRSKTKYYLTYIDGVDIKQIDINKYFDNKDYAAATRLLSMSLRHGCPLEHIIDQLHKSSPSIVEFGSGMSRILKKYVKIEDIQKSNSKCKNCDSTNIEIKMQDGCVTIVCHECNIVDAKCG